MFSSAILFTNWRRSKRDGLLGDCVWVAFESSMKVHQYFDVDMVKVYHIYKLNQVSLSCFKYPKYVFIVFPG